jgi:hypothetical protein
MGLTPDIYWKNLHLISCWLAGSVGSYATRLRAGMPGIAFMDCGYGASEGKFTIPTTPETAASPLAIDGIFFEFRTEDETILSAHELEDGETYELIITTHSGLYRYAIHDLVRVDGFTGTTPNIVFVSKSTETANLCGEKLSPATLDSVIKALTVNGKPIRYWCVVVNEKQFCYNLCLETESSVSTDELQKLAKAFENELHDNAPRLYRIFRQQGLIHPAQATAMKSGWHDAWRASRTRENDAGNQLKMPLICGNIPLPQFIADSSLKGCDAE